MKPSDVLESAANIILRDGWWQGSYFKIPPVTGGGDLAGLGFTESYKASEEEANRSAPCCQDGAISRAATGWAWPNGKAAFESCASAAQAAKWMRRYTEANFEERSPIAWNDAHGRTKEDVVAALRGAAEMAREAGE